MNAILETFDKLHRYGLKPTCGGAVSFKDGDFIFKFHRHSTGQGIEVYLSEGDKLLRIYYDYFWNSSIYEFNENDKKHGYLINDAPWNQALAQKFLELQELVLNTEKRIADTAKAKLEAEEKANANLEMHFRKKYEKVQSV